MSFYKGLDATLGAVPPKLYSTCVCYIAQFITKGGVI